MKRNIIGILGGTFDPVHLGHLRPALEVYEQLPFQEIRFIPCKTPVHKETNLASAEDRVAMLELAICEQAGFTIDGLELERDTPSYSVLTLQTLRERYPQQPLALIIGMDAFLQLPTWYQWEQILDLAHVVVMTRPDSTQNFSSELQIIIKQHEIKDASELGESMYGKLHFQAVTPLAISSRQIREIIRSGKSPKYFLPNSVQQYIGEKGLYR